MDMKGALLSKVSTTPELLDDLAERLNEDVVGTEDEMKDAQWYYCTGCYRMGPCRDLCENCTSAWLDVGFTESILNANAAQIEAGIEQLKNLAANDEQHAARRDLCAHNGKLLLERVKAVTSARREAKRVKLIAIDPQFLVEAFNWAHSERTDVFCIHVEPRLPDDAEVVGVTYDFNRRALLAQVWSESFEPVPAGEQIPFFSDAMGKIRAHSNIRETELGKALRVMTAVSSLNCGRISGHPLTCGNDSNHGNLYPAFDPSGKVLLLCPDCDYTQEYVTNLFRGESEPKPEPAS